MTGLELRNRISSKMGMKDAVDWHFMKSRGHVHLFYTGAREGEPINDTDMIPAYSSVTARRHPDPWNNIKHHPYLLGATPIPPQPIKVAAEPPVPQPLPHSLPMEPLPQPLPQPLPLPLPRRVNNTSTVLSGGWTHTALCEYIMQHRRDMQEPGGFEKRLEIERQHEQEQYERLRLEEHSKQMTRI